MIDPQIYTLAFQVRCFLEPYYMKWHREWGEPIPSPLSTWTCVRSSLFLQKVFELQSIRTEIITGARRHQKEPTETSHAWLLYKSNTIIDITADQFGDTNIVITPSSDARYSAKKEGCCITPSRKAHQIVERMLPDWMVYKKDSDHLFDFRTSE